MLESHEEDVSRSPTRSSTYMPSGLASPSAWKMRQHSNFHAFIPFSDLFFFLNLFLLHTHMRSLSDLHLFLRQHSSDALHLPHPQIHCF